MIAPLLVWRRGEDDFLLLTEPELGETVLAHLTRMRIAAKCEIEPEEHTSAIVLGGSEGIPNDDYGVPAVEVLDGASARKGMGVQVPPRTPLIDSIAPGHRPGALVICPRNRPLVTGLVTENRLGLRQRSADRTERSSSCRR